MQRTIPGLPNKLSSAETYSKNKQTSKQQRLLLDRFGYI